MPVSHVLFESSSGYAIFEAKLSESIGSKSKGVQDSFKDLGKFGKMVSLISFAPFKNAAQALENANDISEGAGLNFYPFIYVLKPQNRHRHPKRFPQKSPRT